MQSPDSVRRAIFEKYERYFEEMDYLQKNQKIQLQSSKNRSKLSERASLKEHLIEKIRLHLKKIR